MCTYTGNNKKTQAGSEVPGMCYSQFAKKRLPGMNFLRTTVVIPHRHEEETCIRTTIVKVCMDSLCHPRTNTIPPLEEREQKQN